jgi:hypothetical protein
MTDKEYCDLGAKWCVGSNGNGYFVMKDGSQVYCPPMKELPKPEGIEDGNSRYFVYIGKKIMERIKMTDLKRLRELAEEMIELEMHPTIEAEGVTYGFSPDRILKLIDAVEKARGALKDLSDNHDWVPLDEWPRATLEGTLKADVIIAKEALREISEILGEGM